MWTIRTEVVPENMMDITASDKSALIRLANQLPKGDESRRAILAGLQKTSALKLPSEVTLSPWVQVNPELWVRKWDTSGVAGGRLGRVEVLGVEDRGFRLHGEDKIPKFQFHVAMYNSAFEMKSLKGRAWTLEEGQKKADKRLLELGYKLR